MTDHLPAAVIEAGAQQILAAVGGADLGGFFDAAKLANDVFLAMLTSTPETLEIISRSIGRTMGWDNYFARAEDVLRSLREGDTTKPAPARN